MNLTMKIYSSDGAGGVAATNMPLSPGDPADKFDCTTMNRATLLEIKKKCIQESEIIYRCSICLKTYSNFGNFQRHYSTTHMTEKKMFPCPLCHREFTRKDNMQAHVRYTHNWSLLLCHTPLREGALFCDWVVCFERKKFIYITGAYVHTEQLQNEI